MTEFRINKLSLEGFRSFKNSELVFPKSNVLLLIGNNGKGKSSVLDAIAFLLIDFIKKIGKENYDNNITLKKSDINNEAKDVAIKGEFGVNQNEFSLILSMNKSIANEPNSIILSSLYHNKPIEWPLLVYYKSYRFFKSLDDFEDNIASFNLPFYDNAFSEQNFDFQDFQTWFRLEEDMENDLIRRERKFEITNPKLDIIRKCIKTFFNSLEGSDMIFSDLRAERIGSKSKLVIQKNAIEFSLEQLSDGEKMLLLMVCDIARRLSDTSYSLNGSGIVLIDEIDMHLHPKWQRNVLPALTKTFPNIQFIATTHSAQVLSRVQRESVRVLDDGKILMVSSNPIGRDTNSILEEIQQVSKRPKEIEILIETYFERINNNNFEEADVFKRQLLDYLDSEDPIFARANAMIERKKMLML